MAFIAVGTLPDGSQETLGVARAHTDPENHTAEFAVLVRSDLKGKGLGSTLLGKLIRYCRARGTKRIVGEVLSDNTRMLHLAEEQGFRIESPMEGCIHVALELAAPAP
jgi:acetyltransferase